jgi:hypothetical protein
MCVVAPRPNHRHRGQREAYEADQGRSKSSRQTGAMVSQSAKFRRAASTRCAALGRLASSSSAAEELLCEESSPRARFSFGPTPVSGPGSCRRKIQTPRLVCLVPRLLSQFKCNLAQLSIRPVCWQQTAQHCSRRPSSTARGVGILSNVVPWGLKAARARATLPVSRWCCLGCCSQNLLQPKLASP